MTVGLTGGRGILGSRIAAHLRRKGYNVSLYPGDVRDMAAVKAWVEGLATVIHAAAMVPVRQVEAELSDAIAINVGGTATVAKAAAKAGCRLVYISSAHVYQSSDRALTEIAPTQPVSLYGLTKLQGEQWVRLVAEAALVLRIFSFFDPRQPTSYLVPSLRARVLAAKLDATLDLDGSANVRDIADAEWMASMIARLSLSGVAGTFNVGTGIPRTVMQVAETVARAVGRSDVRWKAQQEGVPNALLADVRALTAQAGPLPPFDLKTAVATWSGVLLEHPGDTDRKKRNFDV